MSLLAWPLRHDAPCLTRRLRVLLTPRRCAAEGPARGALLDSRLAALAWLRAPMLSRVMMAPAARLLALRAHRARRMEPRGGLAATRRPTRRRTPRARPGSFALAQPLPPGTRWLSPSAWAEAARRTACELRSHQFGLQRKAVPLLLSLRSRSTRREPPSWARPRLAVPAARRRPAVPASRRLPCWRSCSSRRAAERVLPPQGLPQPRLP